MADTITVASKVPMAILIVDPREGDEHVAEPIEINGARHPSGVAGIGLTEGVDAAFFKAWIDANQDHPAVSNGLLYEVDPEQDDVGAEAPIETKADGGPTGANVEPSTDLDSAHTETP